MTAMTVTSLLSWSLSEPIIDALAAGVIVAAVVFLPFAVLVSPIGSVFARNTETRSGGKMSAVGPLWLGLGWFLCFLVVPVVALIERFGLVLPALLFLIVVNFVRFDFEHEGFFGVTVVLIAPVLALCYGLLGALEYWLRRYLVAATQVSIAVPSPPDVLVGNWLLIAALGSSPLLVFLVDQWRQTVGSGEWTVDAYDDERDVPAWMPALPLFVSLLLAAAMVIVPAILYLTLGTLSPLLLQLFGIVPFGNALDTRGLRRRCLNYSLVVPAAVVCALIEYDLRAFWFG